MHVFVMVWMYTTVVCPKIFVNYHASQEASAEIVLQDGKLRDPALPSHPTKHSIWHKLKVTAASSISNSVK